MVDHTTDNDLTIPDGDPQYKTCEYDRMQNASGAASENDITSYSELPAGYYARADPQVSQSPCESSLHSRDTNTKHSKNQRNEQKENNQSKE